MILTDTEIKAALESGELAVTNLVEGSLQAASIDLHLDPRLLFIGGRMDGTPGQETRFLLQPNHVLQPGEFVIASTTEQITLGPNVYGILFGKSSLARMGLVVHQQAGWIDPGFSGTLTLEMSVLRPVQLTAAMPICQLVVGKLRKPAGTPYQGRYQGQHGPTGPRPR